MTVALTNHPYIPGCEALKQTFKRFDAAGSGNIPHKALVLLFMRLNDAFTVEDLDRLLKPFSCNGDVSYVSFLEYLFTDESIVASTSTALSAQNESAADEDTFQEGDLPKSPKKPRGGPRSTVVAYEVLGASADDDAATLKKKYRKQLIENHPDKGGEHEDFIELQEAADKLANKRASFAQAIGRPAKSQVDQASCPAPGDVPELEGQVALEAGHAALQGGQLPVDPNQRAILSGSETVVA